MQSIFSNVLSLKKIKRNCQWLTFVKNCFWSPFLRLRSFTCSSCFWTVCSVYSQGPGSPLKTSKTSQWTSTGCTWSAAWAGRRPVMSWSCTSASSGRADSGNQRMRTKGKRRQSPASLPLAMSKWVLLQHLQLGQFIKEYKVNVVLINVLLISLVLCLQVCEDKRVQRLTVPITCSPL